MGHKRQMQTARMEWINEGRPKTSLQEDYLFDEPALPAAYYDESEKSITRIAPVSENTAKRPKTPDGKNNTEMDDLYDATPRAARKPALTETEGLHREGTGTGSLFGPARVPVVDDRAPEDDLDALLAEEDMMQDATVKAQAVPTPGEFAPQKSSFDDEEEAMADMDMW